MINSIDIRNWQSLKSVNLTLGRFTALVGQTNRGKTAVVRALKALSSNESVHDEITQGQKITSISCSTDEWKITLEKGDGRNSYLLLNLQTNEEFRFTKIGTTVPEQVTAALGMLPLNKGGSIHFASQFDKPFLLDEPGSQSAKVLGEITNTVVIFKAVDDANNKKKNLNAQLKTRESDLAEATEEMEKFADLPEQMHLCDAVESLLEEITSLTVINENLSRCITVIEDAQKDLEGIVVPKTIDISRFEDLLHHNKSISSIVSLIETNRQIYDSNVKRLEELSPKEDELHQQIHRLLSDAGECPTCGQITK